MRHYLRKALIASIAFYVAYTFVPTIKLGNDPQNLAIVIGGILATSVIIQPLFSIVLLPINLLTFGAMSLVLNLALIFAYLKFLPGFAITPYDFPGANFQGFILPAVKLTQAATILAVAVIITLVQKIFHLIFE